MKKIYTRRKEDGKQGKKETIPLFKSSEDTHPLAAGVNVNT